MFKRHVSFLSSKDISVIQGLTEDNKLILLALLPKNYVKNDFVLHITSNGNQ